MTYNKKLIEVALPLEEINNEAIRETNNPFVKGHPKSLKWWARRPLSASRAVLAAQLIDDPSEDCERFPTAEDQDAERQRLFRLLRAACAWDVDNEAPALEELRAAISRSNPGGVTVVDPFCGGGTIPLEAVRLGATSIGNDFNPVAATITRFLIDVAPQSAGLGPIHPKASSRTHRGPYDGYQEDLLLWARQIRDVVRGQLERHYDLNSLPSKPAAWLWARTVPCPNPACNADVYMLSTLQLAKKEGRRRWLKPNVESNGRVSFSVTESDVGLPDPPKAGRGATFRCLACGEVALEEYIRTCGSRGAMAAKCLAACIVGEGGREYVALDEAKGKEALPDVEFQGLDLMIPTNPRYMSPPLYGLTRHRDIYLPRQALALNAISQEIARVAEGLEDAATNSGMSASEAESYARALRFGLALAHSRLVMYSNSLCKWNNTNENVTNPFAMQTVSMAWDFCESYPLDSPVDFEHQAKSIAQIVDRLPVTRRPARAIVGDARTLRGVESPVVVATDPPYYDNVGYADLSDFFYVWLRGLVGQSEPDLTGTIVVPKSGELVADVTRHSGRSTADDYYESGFLAVFERCAQLQDPNAPMTLFYAYKQQESAVRGSRQVASTGWERMLQGLVDAGWAITATWPVRTERASRARGQGSNALASSIVLACRVRASDATVTDRRGFLAALRQELPATLKIIETAHVSPADLAQAAIGPGMAIYSRHARVLESDGTPMKVRAALALVNDVLGEYFDADDGRLDLNTRWAFDWYRQYGLAEGPFGIADTLARAKNVSVSGLVAAGIVLSSAGRVRLRRREELDEDLSPSTDNRLTVWEVLQQTARALQEQGEGAATKVVAAAGGLGDSARELAYRLYVVADRLGMHEEAATYNALVVNWGHLSQTAVDVGAQSAQTVLDV